MAARTRSGVGPSANSSRSTATEAISPNAIIAADANCRTTTATVAVRSALQARWPIRRTIRGSRARTCPTVALDAAPSYTDQYASSSPSAMSPSCGPPGTAAGGSGSSAPRGPGTAPGRMASASPPVLMPPTSNPGVLSGARRCRAAAVRMSGRRAGTAAAVRIGGDEWKRAQRSWCSSVWAADWYWCSKNASDPGP